MDHRVISLWQPWASLLAGGVKTIETRSWPTGWRGLLFVHAGKLANDFTQMVADFWGAALRDLHPSRVVSLESVDLPRGGIVGAVTVADCKSTEELVEDGLSRNELSLGDYSLDRFGWVCVRPVLFRTLIPCRGQQGLFKLDQPTLDLCLAEMRAVAGGGSQSS